MELHEIRYFLALAETLNFTRAAERCNVTQPALTRAVRSLEEKLGGRLVHRERGNTHLTELGRLMLPYFTETAEALDAARRRARDFVRLEAATLRVGMMCTIGPARLAGLFRTFRARFPGIEIGLRDGTAEALAKELVQGGSDLAILGRPDGAPEAMHEIPLYEEAFCLALAPDHPLAARPRVTFADLDGQDYVERASCEFESWIDGLLAAAGIRLRPVYRSERDDWAQAMVRAGLGVALIPESAVTLPDLAVRPLADPPLRRRIGLFTMRGRPHSPAVGAFVELARREFAPRRAGPARSGSVAA